MEITKDTLGMWSVALHGADWLLVAWHRNGQCEAEYRLRYYADDLVFDSKDRKNWYTLTAPTAAPTEFIRVIRQIAGELAARGGEGECPIEILMQNGDVDGFLDEMRLYPCFHEQPAAATT